MLCIFRFLRSMTYAIFWVSVEHLRLPQIGQEVIFRLVLNVLNTFHHLEIFRKNKCSGIWRWRNWHFSPWGRFSAENWLTLHRYHCKKCPEPTQTSNIRVISCVQYIFGTCRDVSTLDHQIFNIFYLSQHPKISKFMLRGVKIEHKLASKCKIKPSNLLKSSILWLYQP